MKTLKYVRVYDNGGATFDRYTVVFTRIGHKHGMRGRSYYLGMSANPFHPQGYGMHGENDGAIDRPTYSHLGKRIRFADLPVDCQRCALSSYSELWADRASAYLAETVQP